VRNWYTISLKWRGNFSLLRADWLITGGGHGDVRMGNVIGARHSIVGGVILHNQTIFCIFSLCIYNKNEKKQHSLNNSNNQ
jgi:hypothetical protein